MFKCTLCLETCTSPIDLCGHLHYACAGCTYSYFHKSLWRFGFDRDNYRRFDRTGCPATGLSSTCPTCRIPITTAAILKSQDCTAYVLLGDDANDAKDQHCTHCDSQGTGLDLAKHQMMCTGAAAPIICCDCGLSFKIADAEAHFLNCTRQPCRLCFDPNEPNTLTVRRDSRAALRIHYNAHESAGDLDNILRTRLSSLMRWVSRSGLTDPERRLNSNVLPNAMHLNEWMLTLPRYFFYLWHVCIVFFVIFFWELSVQLSFSVFYLLPCV